MAILAPKQPLICAAIRVLGDPNNTGSDVVGGLYWIDRSRFDMGDFVQLGDGLVDLLVAVHFGILDRFVRTGVISQSLRTPTGLVGGAEFGLHQ